MFYSYHHHTNIFIYTKACVLKEYMCLYCIHIFCTHSYLLIGTYVHLRVHMYAKTHMLYAFTKMNIFAYSNTYKNAHDSYILAPYT